MSVWNWLDSTLLGIVALSVVMAALKGFFRELIALATFVAAVIIAALGYRWAAGWFEDLTRSHPIALAAGFLTLFLGTLLVGAAVAAVGKQLIKTAGLQPFDRFLGALFGLIRGVLVDSVLLMVLVAFSVKPQAVEQSTLAPYISAGARVVVWVMPRDLKDKFHAGLAKLRKAFIDRAQNKAQEEKKPGQKAKKRP